MSWVSRRQEDRLEMRLDVGEETDVVRPVDGAIVTEGDPAIEAGVSQCSPQGAWSPPQLVVGNGRVSSDFADGGLGLCVAHGLLGLAQLGALDARSVPGAATSPRSIAAA